MQIVPAIARPAHCAGPGQDHPVQAASADVALPPTRHLIVATCRGSRCASQRLAVLWSAEQRQADATSAPPTPDERTASAPDPGGASETPTPAATTPAAPATPRQPGRSRPITIPATTVNTASRF